MSGRVVDARLLWQRVERALREGTVDVPSGVERERLVETLKKLPLFQVTAIVDLAERTSQGEAGGDSSRLG